MLNPKERMAELAHDLCQRGPSMRERSFSHPPIFRKMSQLHNSGVGRKVRSDANGIVAAAGSSVTEVRGMIAAAGLSSSRMIRAISSIKALWYTQQKRSPWRHHQSVAFEKRGRCAYNKCPGIADSKSKVPRCYETNMRCEECTVLLGRDIFLCNGTKGLVEGEKRTWKVCLCHVEYHKLMFNNK
jgi:hypothetical protein